ncbi:MAG: hypothetical protein ACE5R6_20670 [Candidatus Heimdallarchaeota archaeon]
MNKPKEAIGIFVAFLFLSASILLVLNTPANADTTTHVTYSVNTSVASGSFSTDVSTSGDSVEPGGSTTITFDVQQGSALLMVDFGKYGSESITFDTPLSSISVPIYGIGELASIIVDLSGMLKGDLSVKGPGFLSTNHLSWSSWGKKSVTLDASNAEDGDTITVRLILEYTANIGATAETILGDKTLISPRRLAGVQGSPPVTLTVDVKKGGIPGFELVVTLGAIIAVISLKKIKVKNERKIS